MHALLFVIGFIIAENKTNAAFRFFSGGAILKFPSIVCLTRTQSLGEKKPGNGTLPWCVLSCIRKVLLTPPPTFSDTQITNRHPGKCDTFFSLGTIPGLLD